MFGIPSYHTRRVKRGIAGECIGSVVELARDKDINGFGWDNQRSVVPAKSNVVIDFVVCRSRYGGRSDHLDATRRVLGIDARWYLARFGGL